MQTLGRRAAGSLGRQHGQPLWPGMCIRSLAEGPWPSWGAARVSRCFLKAGGGTLAPCPLLGKYQLCREPQEGWSCLCRMESAP